MSDDEYRADSFTEEEEEDDEYQADSDGDWSEEEEASKPKKARKTPQQKTPAAAGAGNSGGKLALSVLGKRPRPWSTCEDVEELRRMLDEKQAEVERLEAQLAAAGRSGAAGLLLPAAAAKAAKTETPEALLAMAEKMRKTISKQLTAQMVYKPSVRCTFTRSV